jgi:hypothetical protein
MKLSAGRSLREGEILNLESAKSRLQALTGLAEAADDEDALALDTLLNEIDGLRADLHTADKAYREECEKNRKLKSLLRAMMKYIVEEGDNDEDKL